MLNLKGKYISAIIVFVLCLQFASGLTFAVEESTAAITPVPEMSAPENDEWSSEFEAENEEALPDDYNQAIIDEINNNPIPTNDANESITSTDADYISEYAVPEQEIQTYASALETPSQFKAEPITSPYNVVNYNEDAVSLGTGALTYNKLLLSLPGRNGLDLNLSVRYDSNDAIISKNNYNAYDNNREENLNQIAIGWSFQFTRIIKSTVKKQYGRYEETHIRFTDGRSYKISGDLDSPTTDITFTLPAEATDVVSLVKKADTKEYVLTYTDGRVEYFDGDFGNIQKIVDRFGNQILFEYTEFQLFHGTFTDYLYNPSYYTQNVAALSKITDSIGREINIEYFLSSSYLTDYGNFIYKISIDLDGNTRATLEMSRAKSYNGVVSVLEEITDGENFKTTFEYDEQISNIYTPPMVGTEESLTVEGSAFLLTGVVQPTGGKITYRYEKARRSYSFVPINSFNRYVGWYDVFKVSKTMRGIEFVTSYFYEHDYSGYPHSYPNEYSESGNITDTTAQYHTLVRKHNQETVYTFDYQHNLIQEQTYDGMNSYHMGKGESKWNVIIDNSLYRVNLSEGSLYLYEQPVSEIITFSNGLQVGSTTIQSVKTKNKKIFVFYTKDDTYFVKAYDTQSKVWSDAGEVSAETFPVTFDLSKVYYANGVFYTYTVSGNSLYQMIYDDI